MTPSKKQLKGRRLTIGSKPYPRAYYKYVFYPQILLAGKWMEGIGFKSGAMVSVKYARGKIIITTEK